MNACLYELCQNSVRVTENALFSTLSFMFQSKRVSFPFQYFISFFVIKVVLDFFVNFVECFKLLFFDYLFFD